MNPIFQNKINQARVDPRITVAISFNISNTDVVYLTSHADGVAPVGAVVFQNVIKSGSSESAKASILKGEFTIGGGSIKIIDDAGQISQLLADKRALNKGIRGQRIQEWAGAAGMSFSDYHLVNSFIIDGSVVYDSGIYTINSRDIQAQIQVDIFDPEKGNLSKSVTADQTHIPILTTDNFAATYHDAAHSYRPSQTYGLAKIGTKSGYEIIAHSGIFTHSTDGPSLQIIERGIFGTTASAHDVDPTTQANRQIQIAEYIYREGPAPKLLIETLLGKFHGGQPMPPHWGVGIDSALIDTASFENSPHWDAATDAGTLLRFEDIGRTKAKTWCQNEVLRWITSFIRINNNGSLRLQATSTPTPAASYSFLIDESNCLSVGAISHNQSAVANIFSMQWGWNPELKQFLKDGPTFIDGTSIAREQTGQKIEWKMKGVSSGSATDSDIANVFDGLRASYSAPPITTTVTCNLSAAGIEVGENVRLNINNLLDANTGKSLNRTFRVDKKVFDFRSGKVTLQIFGAPIAAGAISRALGTTALDDAAYAGKTDLSTQIPITNNATAGGTITGGATMAAGEYAHQGDLAINGAIMAIGGNVRLWIMGFLTINSAIDLTGQGMAGGAPATDVYPGVGWQATGTPGYIGSSIGTEEAGYPTPSAAGLVLGYYNGGIRSTGQHDSAPFLPLKNNGSSVDGLMIDGRGTGGVGGRLAYGDGGLFGAGGAGGAGGGSIEIICRGISFGANGQIITNGGDGQSGQTVAIYSNSSLLGGHGAGGEPGVVTIILDGNHSPPVIAGNIVCNSGSGSGSATEIPEGGVLYSDIAAGSPWAAPYSPTSSESRVDSCVRVQYLQPQQTAQQDANPVHKLPLITQFTAADGTIEPPVPANQGQSLQQIELGWQAITDPDCSGYEIQSKQTATASYRTISRTSDPATTYAAFSASQSVPYSIRIRAISSRGALGHSDWATISHTLANAPAAVEWGQLDKASSGIPSDNATLGATWGQNIGGQNLPANNADVTADNTAGTAVNIVPAQYSLFSIAAEPPLKKSINSFVVIASAVGFFGANSLRIESINDDAWCYLGSGYYDYNIKISPLKKWIISFYALGLSSAGGLAEVPMMCFLKTDDEIHRNGGVMTTAPNDWSRFSFVLDLSASSSKNMLLRFDNDIAGNILFIDGVMIEEQVGNNSTPSAFSPPAGESNLFADWTAPALADLKPAAAGADPTAQNIALGADTGEIGVNNKRIFINPSSGEMEIHADAGAGIETVGTIGLKTTGIDLAVAEFGTQSVGVDKWGVIGRSNAGLAGYFVSSTFNGIYAKSEGGGLGVIGESSLGTGVKGTSLGGAFAFGGEFVATGSGAVGVQSRGPAGGAAFYAASGSYLPFTGAHPAIIESDLNPCVGDIICENEIVAHSGISDAIALSGFGKHKEAAIGVYTSSIPFSDLDRPSDPALAGLTECEYEAVTEGRERAFVNALGDGLVNVCDERGAIKKGDLIVVADRSGKGCLQEIEGEVDETMRSYTFAIAREPAIFDDCGIAQIACFYRCG